MKRFLYIIMLTFCGLAVFAQSPSKYVNLLPAYPPAIGETQYDNFVYTNSGLYMHDIILDSLPHYEIEHIPDQTVRYLEDGVGFYVKADSLHSNQVVYSYEVDELPIGPFEFNATTGRFKFYPDAGDYKTFNVTFTATAGLRSLSQTVEFTIIPEVVPENLAIQNLGEMPSYQDYTIFAESQTEMFLNNANRTVHSYSISGKDVVFDNNVQNKVWGLSDMENLYELNIFAERLYIRSALKFPQTNVNIYAKELIFEDKENEIASINTTPLPIETITNVEAMDGGNAGNITLNIKSLKADFAKRFILNGAQGQCSNRNGTPGDGGNGGVLIASIDVEQYCDFSRGSAGLKYETDGSILKAGQIGENGHFELLTDRYSWIHPYYIAAVIRHINDSYLNNYFTYSKTTANDYYNLINEFEASEEWENFDGTLKVELLDQRTELQGMLYKLNEDLDYFGNPLGWAPMLSFEVFLNNYNNEIDRAMPTLYLNYWLQHIDQTLESWATASAVAASQTQSDIVAAQEQINSLTNNIPVLEDKITVLQNQIEETQNRLEQIKAELLRKATHNVKKRNRLNKAFGIAKAALNCIPVYGNIASGVVSVVQTVGSDYFGLSDTYGYESAITDTYQSITNFDYSSALGDLKQAIDSIDLNHLGQTGHQLKDSYDSLKTSIGPVYNSITNLQQVLAQSSAPDDQVQAEFDKLCSESADYQNIKAEISALQQSYVEFGAILTQTFVNIVNLTSEVSNEMVTLDALRNDVFQGNSKRDLQAMQCVEKMRQRAMNRLVKYHYYMRKAYEYRLLKSYQGEFSLETMYNRIEALIDQGQIIFDSATPANLTDYSALSAVFRQEVSGVIENIIDELNYNAPEQTATISIVIPHEVLDKINANEEYDLNMFDLGLFSPDEENIRIVGFDVQYMEAHTVGNGGMSTYMDIDLKHNGISRFRKNGEVYWFNHISTSTQNPHPNTWSIRYNPFTQQTTTIGPSLATQSLLYSLLGGNTENIMLFSRPSAWSNIYMSKKIHTTGNADIIIDSLVLSLQYDFTRRPDAIRNIDIATSNGLLAYITCSEADRNGRSNGKGCFHRSYTRSSGTVTFTTTEKHGNYYFLNWTDRLGNIVAETPALTINKMTDQFYRANYELHIPVLNVADTIYVGYEGGEYEVQIQNIGLGDIEMDWYVSDSLSTWVHIDGIAEGIDNGNFTFTYEAFTSQGSRIDSLEILAPEIEGMSKTVYIVQYDHSLSEVITAYANPTNGGTVNGAGTYNYGTSCTLTATPATGYTFAKWTKDGTDVSTNTSYTFTVTENASYVAHFAPNSYTIAVTADPFVGGSVNGAGSYDYNSECTLTATAANGYTFSKWTKDGTDVSTNTSYTFIVTENASYVAHFSQNTSNNYTVFVSSNPTNGGIVTGGGTYYDGQSCTVSATPAIGYNFVSWKENGVIVSNNANYTFTVTGNRNLVANFSSEAYTITATANPAEGGSVSGADTYIYGITATLTATTNTGYTFVKWTKNGVVVSTSATYTFTVTESGDYIANFSLNNYEITATANPTEGGTIDGADTYGYGSTATLTATANEGYHFVNWTKNGIEVSAESSYSFTVIEAGNYVANFELNSYEVTATANPATGGTIEGADTYVYGSTATLIATPNQNYVFDNWTENGIVVSVDSSYSFTMTANRALIANFIFVDGIGEQNGIEANIYPNPTKGKITVEAVNLRRVSVFNTFGQKVFEATASGNSTECDLRGCAVGVYSMQIETTNGIVTKRVVVEK